MSKIGQALASLHDAMPMQSFEVAAIKIDGKPLRVYHKLRTLADAAKVEAAVRETNSDVRDSLVYTIIFEALDEHGNPMFDLADKEILRTKLHPAIINQMASRLCEFTPLEDIKKS